MFIGAAVVAAIALIAFILAFGFIAIGVMEVRENLERKELVKKRMEGKE